jgi:hypothetical protein
MTAKELKQALANVPDDAEVYMDAYASGRENVIKVVYDDEDNSFELY